MPAPMCQLCIVYTIDRSITFFQQHHQHIWIFNISPLTNTRWKTHSSELEELYSDTSDKISQRYCWVSKDICTWVRYLYLLRILRSESVFEGAHICICMGEGESPDVSCPMKGFCSKLSLLVRVSQKNTFVSDLLSSLTTGGE